MPAPTYTYRTPNPIRPQPPQTENSTASPISTTPNRVDIRDYLDPPLPREVNEEVVGLHRLDSMFGDDPSECGGGCQRGSHVLTTVTLQLVTVHEADTLHVL